MFRYYIEWFKIWWNFRPTKKRDWHVICTWGGSQFPLPKTAQKDLHKELAPGFVICHIDVEHALVFVHDQAARMTGANFPRHGVI